MPLVSVVMSVYNDGHYVRQAIDSILAQTFTDFEFLIVDDGCTDNTRAIVENYQDARIRLVVNERNLGLAPSLNKAMRLSGAKYVARQDADDVSFAQRFSHEVDYLESHPEVGLVGTAAIVTSHRGEWQRPWRAIAQDIDLKWSLLFCNPFVHSSIMMRRSTLDQVGYYTEEPEVAKAFAEDYELWSRMNRVSRSANLPWPLLEFRQNPTSASVRTWDAQLEQIDQIALRNIGWVLNRDSTSAGERKAFADVNALFRSRDGRDPRLSPVSLRSAFAFLAELQQAFYGRYQFSRSDIAVHRRHWSWIWGKHLCKLSLCTRAGTATKFTLAALGSRCMRRLVSAG
jgi:hypothetical protein